jgi:hypothetical protein
MLYKVDVIDSLCMIGQKVDVLKVDVLVTDHFNMTKEQFIFRDVYADNTMQMQQKNCKCLLLEWRKNGSQGNTYLVERSGEKNKRGREEDKHTERETERKQKGEISD